MRIFDCIVIGSGAMGLAVQYYANQKGLQTLALEQFSLAHDRGSTHGQTRAIHCGYYQEPMYLSLVQRAFGLWEDLEHRASAKILHRVGKLEVHQQTDVDYAAIKRASEDYHFPIQCFEHARLLRQRFPQFVFDDNQIGIYQPQSGFLAIDAARSAFDAAIDRKRVELRTHERVLDWQIKQDLVMVHTDQNHYLAKYCVITPGAWVSLLKLPLLPQPKILRKALCWYDRKFLSDHVDYTTMPVFDYYSKGDLFYGFPVFADQIKIARHTGGQSFDQVDLVETASDNISEITAIENFAKQQVRVITTPAKHTAHCFYTMTTDKHFILDRHPYHENVFLGAGFSGHGYKFTPAVGELLVKMITGEALDVDIAKLSVQRFVSG